jgi:hypothetical protein
LQINLGLLKIGVLLKFLHSDFQILVICDLLVECLYLLSLLSQLITIFLQLLPYILVLQLQGRRVVLPLVGLNLKSNFLVDRRIHSIAHIVTQFDGFTRRQLSFLLLVSCKPQVRRLPAVLSLQLLVDFGIFCELVCQILRLQQELEELCGLNSEQVEELRVNLRILRVETARLHRLEQPVLDKACSLLLGFLLVLL